MKQGKHQLRIGFNSLTHNVSRPQRFILDNGDYTRNFRIESVEWMPANVDNGTNNTNFSNQACFLTVGLTEQGATAINQGTSSNRAYSLRITDRRQIAWGVFEEGMGSEVIMDPWNIVSGDLYVNAWSIGTGKDLEDLAQDMMVLITMTEVRQSGNEALLTAVRDDPLD